MMILIELDFLNIGEKSQGTPELLHSTAQQLGFSVTSHGGDQVDPQRSWISASQTPRACWIAVVKSYDRFVLA